MLDSRKIEDLHPKLRDLCNKHIFACAKRGVKIIVTSTLRDQECQSKLYAQGRAFPGPIVTNMQFIGPHGFGLAYDVVPVVEGKAVWNNEKLWTIVGEEGKKLGLIWGGDWKSIKDNPHFQNTDGLTAEELRAGRRPKWWNGGNPVSSASNGIVTADNLNVRKKPSSNGEVVSKLQKGASVSILETVDGWHRIGADKWVSSKYIKTV